MSTRYWHCPTFAPSAHHVFGFPRLYIYCSKLRPLFCVAAFTGSSARSSPSGTSSLCLIQSYKTVLNCSKSLKLRKVKPSACQRVSQVTSGEKKTNKPTNHKQLPGKKKNLLENYLNCSAGRGSRNKPETGKRPCTV